MIFFRKDVWNATSCKIIKHCVYNTNCPEGDINCSIGRHINNGKLPIVPHMIALPNSSENLRQTLNIPLNASVFGRLGGYDMFNIPFVRQAIKNHLRSCENSYFIFMNTKPFFKHERLIYLDKNVDLDYKVKFINTCDAMIHASRDGETFGLAVGEFSSKK